MSTDISVTYQAAPDLRAALSRVADPLKLLIDGRLTDPANGRMMERVSPAHGVVVSRFPQARHEEVEAAVRAARRAFDEGPWPQMTGAERAHILHKTAGLIEADLEQLALLDVLESGKPLTQARGEIASAVDIWRYAAGLARDVHGDSYAQIGSTRLGVVIREPIGVVSLITPWNFPFLILSQKLPFALAAGCTAVVKPSEMTSGSTLRLGKLLLEAGLPPGVANIIAGGGPDVGAAMMSHPMVDMVSFTGSTRVGKQAMRVAADSLKKVVTELGGKNPQIVFADADMDAAVDAAVFGAFFNAGECCNAGCLLILERSIAESFLTEVTRYASTVKVGDPLDPATKVGALISAEHLRSVEQRVTEAVEDGATLRSGGSRLSDLPGLFMSPTVLSNIRPDMRIAREEIFGPVVSAITFETTEDAVRIANRAIDDRGDGFRNERTRLAATSAARCRTSRTRGSVARGAPTRTRAASPGCRTATRGALCARREQYALISLPAIRKSRHIRGADCCNLDFRRRSRRGRAFFNRLSSNWVGTNLGLTCCRLHAIITVDCEINGIKRSYVVAAESR